MNDQHSDFNIYLTTDEPTNIFIISVHSGFNNACGDVFSAICFTIIQALLQLVSGYLVTVQTEIKGDL
jgi:hypothetical protein